MTFSRPKTSVRCAPRWGPRVGLALLPLFSLATFTGRSATAQTEPSPSLVPPRAVEPLQAEYPREALAARVEGSVVLRLTIDRGGQVSAVEVVEPAGHGFDEAATAAVRKLRFEPAQRDGAPVAARILYRYTFRLPVETTVAAPAPATAAPAGAATATAAPPPAGGAAPTSTPPAVDVTVRGQQSQAQRLRGSAEAVTVVETRRAQQQARDLGEVLGSIEGVALRRTGGLGSLTRFSLNGLQDEQVRFFLDEVPLDVAGSAFGIAKVPVNLVERIEVYRGVLPVRFGADALGGGVNLVTDQKYETRASVSYQRGSFGTHRASLLGRYRHEPSGFFIGATAWFDRARNDYEVEVDIADETGRVHPTTVKRLHDDYLGYGGSLELGVTDAPGARRLIFRLFGSTFAKEIQHNGIMTIPYGEARYGETVLGATARYEQPLLSNLALSLVAGGAHRTIEFVDVADWVYDWYGRRITARAGRGEVQDTPHDVSLWQRNLFGRAQLEWRPAPEHALRLASTARFFARNGHERAFTTPEGLDPAAAWKDLSVIASGLEYQLDAVAKGAAEAGATSVADAARDHRLQNIAFVKHYFFAASTSEPLSLDVQELHVERHHFGLGDGLRFRITEQLLAKASYEWAARFPNMDELYGDGALFVPNGQLEPETSHNVNAGLRLDLRRTKVGRFASELHGFLRETDKLIVPLTAVIGGISQYQNISRARALGVEGSLSWTSPGDWLVLDGNATWQDVRNTSGEGPFGSFEGDRIPNRPWLFANWSGRLQWRAVMTPDDELAPFYWGRYVHEFFRGWESVGNPQIKARIPSQVVHSLGLSYIVRLPARVVTTLEIDNLADARLYDSFGAQRPGRSFAVKVTGDL